MMHFKSQKPSRPPRPGRPSIIQHQNINIHSRSHKPSRPPHPGRPSNIQHQSINIHSRSQKPHPSNIQHLFLLSFLMVEGQVGRQVFKFWRSIFFILILLLSCKD